MNQQSSCLVGAFGPKPPSSTDCLVGPPYSPFARSSGVYMRHLTHVVAIHYKIVIVSLNKCLDFAAACARGGTSSGSCYKFTKLQATHYKCTPATCKHVCTPATAWDVNFIIFFPNAYTLQIITQMRYRSARKR